MNYQKQKEELVDMAQPEKTKNNKMNKYKIEFFFRHGKFEKDFDQIEIEADTEEEAIQLVKDLRSWVFKIDILEINGKKVNT